MAKTQKREAPTPVAKKVYAERNARTGDVVLSRRPAKWSEIFAALDKAGVPDDFLSDRDETMPQQRLT